MTDEQRRAYAEAYARAEADWPGAMAVFLLGEPLPAEVTAVASVLGLDPGELDWHVEAGHGWEPHDEGYEAHVWAAAACDDPGHLEESRRAGARRAVVPVQPGVIAAHPCPARREALVPDRAAGRRVGDLRGRRARGPRLPVRRHARPALPLARPSRVRRELEAVTAHEIVIRLARAFDIRTGNGAFTASISEITVPFADWQSAEAALREITLSVRAVHDTGGEDYRPVVAGEVVRADSASECLCLPPGRESRAVTSACPAHSAPTATGKPLLRADAGRHDALRKSARDAHAEGTITRDGLQDRLRRIAFMERQAEGE